MPRVHQRKTSKKAVGGMRLKAAGAARRHQKRGSKYTTIEENVKGTELRRLAQRAGHVKISKKSYPEMRRILFEPIHELVRAAMVVTQADKRKQVSLADLDYAIHREAVAGHLPRPYGPPKA